MHDLSMATAKVVPGDSYVLSQLSTEDLFFTKVSQAPLALHGMVCDMRLYLCHGHALQRFHHVTSSELG